MANEKAIRSSELGDGFYAGLTNPDEAAAYLEDVLLEKGARKKKHILKALRDIARAHGIKNLARGSESKRRAIYKSLSDKGNPSLETLLALLEGFGLRLSVEPLKKAV
jgi:probable addiction module antidote protein